MLPDALLCFLCKSKRKFKNAKGCFGAMGRGMTLELNVGEWGVHGTYSRP